MSSYGYVNTGFQDMAFLSPVEHKVLSALYEWVGKDTNKTYKNFADISTKINMTEQTARKTIQLLEEKAIVIVSNGATYLSPEVFTKVKPNTKTYVNIVK